MRDLHEARFQSRTGRFFDESTSAMINHRLARNKATPKVTNNLESGVNDFGEKHRVAVATEGMFPNIAMDSLSELPL